MILQHLNGTMGSRWDNEKKWNLLRLEDEETGEKIDPRLSLLGMEDNDSERYKFRTSLMMETKY